MKQKLLNSLRLRACLLVAVLCGAFSNAWGETATFTFSELASANSWSNGTAYTSVVISPITLSAAGGGNNGKYYTSDQSWRMYNGGTVNITAADGYEVTAVSSTPSQSFTISNGAASLSCTATIRFTAITVTYSSGGTPTPSISANNVDIAYSATSGSIAYTINNPTSETLGASTTSDWLTLGTVGTGTVPFTCSANSTKAARTATVTLTYGSVTKNVTVTQAANPNAIDNISDITAAGTYSVRGTIVAKSQRGFIVGDGTGYVYYYNQDYTQADYNIGDKVKLSGSVVAYGGVFEFNSSTTITPATESNYAAEAPTVLTGSQMDTRVASTTPAQLSSYIQYEGILTINDTHYNITNIDGASTAKGSISYPLNTDFTSLNGKNVKVTGYFVGVSSSQYYNTLIGSIEEVISTTPVILVNQNSLQLEYNATSGSINYSITNPADGVNLSATTTAGWISNIEVGSEAVTFTTTANDGNEDRTATITLSYIGAEDKVVTITQKHYVADYASLPFEFDGGKADVENTPGLSEEGLDSDYGSSPKLKFNTTNDYLILKFNERPGTLTFDIKGNTFSDGTFKVQVSEDGATYTDLGTYTELGTTQHESFDNLGENVRYIKWIYTEKVNGNVALGNISLTAYGETPTYTVSWTAGENIDLFVFAGDESETIENGSSVDEGTTVMVSVDVADGYELEALTVKDAEENDISLTEIEAGVYFSFEMPESNVTITATAVESSVTPVTGDKYVKVTSIDDLTDGQYLIVCEDEDVAFNGGLETLDAVSNTIPVTISNDEIVANATTQAAEFTISVTDGTILSASGFFIGQTSNNNGLLASEETEYSNSISFSDGDADILSSGGAYLRYNAASNQTRFRYFKSSSYTNQKAVQLYKFVEGVEPITVTISDALYTTYVTPADLDFTGDVTAYVVDRIDANSMHMERIDKVPEGTPVILKAEEAGTYTLNTADKTDDVVNLLQASYGDIEGGENIYALAKKNGVVGFYQVSSDVTIPAGKAYLDINKTNASEGNVKAFLAFDFSAGEDAIKGVESDSKNAVIFNIAGQRVNHASHGLYIINGKKVIVK